jgi:hypothetical protein
MSKNEPTLRIDIRKRGNPRCSACGQEFGGEGLTRDLIEAFALHARRNHLHPELNHIVARANVSRTAPRTRQAGVQN